MQPLDSQGLVAWHWSRDPVWADVGKIAAVWEKLRMRLCDFCLCGSSSVVQSSTFGQEVMLSCSNLIHSCCACFWMVVVVALAVVAAVVVLLLGSRGWVCKLMGG